jgi:hypothetical protein
MGSGPFHLYTSLISQHLANLIINEENKTSKIKLKVKNKIKYNIEKYQNIRYIDQKIDIFIFAYHC